MAISKQTSFTVEGSGMFPVDMLRYDACWPATTEDVIHMALGSPIARSKQRRVALFTNAQNRPTVGRWESFGWKIV